MERIFKYPLDVTARQSLVVPSMFQPLSVQLQDDNLCLWASVYDEAASYQFIVTIIGTGHELPEDAGSHISTVQMGQLVCHVYGRLVA